MLKDFTVGVATGRHDGCTYLAKSHAMAPATTDKTDFCPLTCLRDNFTGFCHILDIESRTFQMGFREKPPDFQLLANSYSLMFPDNAKKIYSAGFSPFERFKSLYRACHHSEFSLYYLTDFFRIENFSPLIKVDSLLIVIIQHLPQNILILCIAEALRFSVVSRRIRKCLQIWKLWHLTFKIRFMTTVTT